METSEALAQFVRGEAAQLVVSLTHQLGNFDLAEDAVQDAIVEAFAHWRTDGVPRQPGAWLRVTARRKATDRLRREARYRGLLPAIAPLDEDPTEFRASPTDDRLVLLFMCCHPALSREAQIALTLRSVLGLTTAQLAKAFLTSESTMTKRIARTKRKIVEAGISLAIPAGMEAEARLGEILACIYVMFNEGYLSAGPDAAARAELADDAEWLARVLAELVPTEPEALGLLALIRLQQARRAARFAADGELVLMRDQDRSLWNRAAIDDALGILNRAMKEGRPGFYQCQAAIAGCHAIARSWEDIRWDLIISLYDQLLSYTDSPVVALNRAIAIQFRDGPNQALAALESLLPQLGSYHLFHATRAELLRALGRHREAIGEDRQAAQLTGNPAELRLLRQRIREAAVVDLDGIFSKN